MKEEFLIDSGDSKQLVEFYKSNLLEHPEFKVKLVNLYLNMDDIKSAELYRNTYDDDDMNNAENVYSIARIDYEKNSLSTSKETLEKYLDKGGDKAEYYLLLGKISAKQRHYSQAIEEFEKSRTLGVSDHEASNNIAVVKLMQGEYSEATKILLSLYLDNPSDKKVRSNLILASAKAGRPDITLDVLKKTNSDSQARAQLATLMKSVSKQKNLDKVPAKVNMTKINSEKLEHRTLNKEKLDIEKQNENMKFSPRAVYRVQVFASRNALSVEYLDYLKTNYGTVYSYTNGLWKRYCIGNFKDLNKAREFIKTIEIKGAFIVDYHNQSYITL
ncbi:tetratricopeptide repeat protein [Vibrio parahaemolyticus]|uniref:tetratricopeptide repeat protein n=1 Tax=Vibrio parahaemolyticus TaxID=670 RepID=UPI0038924459